MRPSFDAGRRRLTALRLTALGVARPDPEPPAATVRRLLALQGQDYAGALWSIGLRSGARAETVEAALRDGGLVRSWPVRSTLHVVAADDLPWLLALTADREHRAAAGRHRQLGLEASDFAAAESAARARLGSGPAERRELLDAIAAEGVDVTGQRGAHLLVRIAQLGVAALCGATTWAALPRAAAATGFDREAALRELARRFLAARGPATERDLAWWSGLTLGDARAAIAEVDDEFDRIEIGGVVYRMRPGLEEAGRGVHALPGFDEYLLGYADRSAPLAGRPLTTVVPGGNGMFLPSVVADGRIVGTWRREVRARGVAIAVSPLEELSARIRRGFEAAAERYAAHLGVPLLSVG